MNNIVGLNHTLERKGPIHPRMTDGGINNYVGSTCCFRKPDVRVRNGTTVGPLDADGNRSGGKRSFQIDVSSDVLSIGYCVNLS